ncbi:unnamed protein product [Dovyalis caffra]|uniref:Uncharacterized protein n=1 Tax=Dovyalis caffra TaxID=77055 RepID=A0AAV1QNY7_9ROSI|nr:unnamed protein product [Dovyalis caffra]
MDKIMTKNAVLWRSLYCEVKSNDQKYYEIFVGQILSKKIIQIMQALKEMLFPRTKKLLGNKSQTGV